MRCDEGIGRAAAGFAGAGADQVSFSSGILSTTFSRAGRATMRLAVTDNTHGRCNASSFEDSLDPADWEQARTFAHRMVDDAIMDLRSVRDQSV